MSDDEQQEKTSLEKASDVSSELKDMIHYSRSSLEKLAEFWFLMEDEIKRKDIAEKLQDVQTKLGASHDAMEALAEFIDMEVNRIESEGGTEL